jgi:hypothetical protein
MNSTIDADEGEVDKQEGQASIAIRKALSGATIEVSQNVDYGVLFTDIDAFVKLSQGNTSVKEIHFYPFDKKGDDELWEKMGEGLANLKSLTHLMVTFERWSLYGEPNPRADFRTLAIVLPYLRQNLIVASNRPQAPEANYCRKEVKALARAIRRHPTIKQFFAISDFSMDVLHILLSALSTLPSLEVAYLKLRSRGNSHCELPEALKRLMLSPSLRTVCFANVVFCKPLCRAFGEALQEGSNVSLLSFDKCFFPATASVLVARAFEQSTTVATVRLSGDFSKTFYDAFAVTLLINTTVATLELTIPDDEAEAALMAPVLLALGMNKALKNLTMDTVFSGAGPVLYNAIRDGLEKNSTLEMLHIFTSVNVEQYSINLVYALLPFLRVSETLNFLKITFEEASMVNDPDQMATLCLAVVTALPKTSSLETLEIHSADGVIAHDTYITALESALMNTALKKLRLSPIIASFGEAEMNQVVSLVKKNYTLTELDEDITEHDETGKLGSILRLNQAGRRYLIDDAGSIPKGVKVLIDVTDDLDCLFYHLLENPTLCDI